MDAELKKLAADAIIQLRDEVLEKTAELEISNKAHGLAFKLFKLGSIPAEELESSIEKFASKTIEELNLMDKAIEFNIREGNTKFGTLSSRIQDDDTLDPLTRYLLQDVL
jgi:hypothetical protein